MLRKYAVKQGRPDAARYHRADKDRYKLHGAKSGTTLHQGSDEVILPQMDGQDKPSGGKDLYFNDVQREGK